MCQLLSFPRIIVWYSNHAQRSPLHTSQEIIYIYISGNLQHALKKVLIHGKYYQNSENHYANIVQWSCNIRIHVVPLKQYGHVKVLLSWEFKIPPTMPPQEMSP